MSSPAEAPSRQTPLYARHRQLGARLIDFGGWTMPLSYTGIIDEHRAVRSAAGLFDVSHMGEVSFRGLGAARAVQRLVTNDVGKLKDGGAFYTVVCRPSGGIIDDCLVYRSSGDEYLIVVNASTTAKDLAWFRDQTGALCELEDVSDETALLAVQGPRAVELVQSLTRDPVRELAPFSFGRAQVSGIATRVARTGYTGEDGFEIFTGAEAAPRLWDALLSAGAAVGLKPAGLGARDTLRLEARLCLYGNDIDEEHTPHEAGLSWVVKGRGFIGEEALAHQLATGVTRRLIGFKVLDRGIARHGYAILDREGHQVGTVTSGTIGPTVGVAIGMGYVPLALSSAGEHLMMDCRGKQARAEVVKGPFYKRVS